VEKVDSNALSDQAIDEAIKKSLEMQNKPATPEAIAAMRPQMRATMKQVQSTLKAGFESVIGQSIRCLAGVRIELAGRGNTLPLFPAEFLSQ